MKHLDLHMHSNISLDADFAPCELMAMCARAGLDTVALSDHNSVRGIKEAAQAAKQWGIQLIPAIELDTTLDQTDLHILGYGVDISFGAFAGHEVAAVGQERDTSMELLERVRDLGIFVHTDDVLALAREGVINAEMIAEAAMRDERNAQNPLLRPYFPGGARSDNPYVNFYWDYTTRGKPAYVGLHYISLDEGVRMITLAGGIPVLAHPYNVIGKDAEMLARILARGVKGIEVYSGYHDAETAAFYRDLADKHRVLKTVGSDFHGKIKPALRLGGVPCDVEDEIYAGISQAIAG